MRQQNVFLSTVISALCVATMSAAQSRSGNVYEFLDLPTTAHSTAIGGNHAAMGTAEPGFFFHNPAILNDTLTGSISLNITPLPADVVHGSAAYAHHVKNLGTFAAGVQYINYGSFDKTDEFDVEYGTFRAQEAAIYLTYARQMTPRLTLAATLKPIISSFDTYTSIGLAMGMGAMYVSANGRFTAGAVLRNLGAQITTYDGSHEHLNTDARLGFTYKTEHAPFRFSLTLKDLFHWDLSTNRDNKISFGDNLMRHMLIGLEVVPFRNFFVGFGYDHRRRKEMYAKESGGMAGFSWGFGLRVFKIDIAYGSGRYHLAGSSNSISISTNINRFIKTR